MEKQMTRLEIYLINFVNWIFHDKREEELLKKRNVRKHVEENQDGEDIFYDIIIRMKVGKRRQYYTKLYRAVNVRNEYNKYIEKKTKAFVKILGHKPSMGALYNLSESDYKTRYSL